MSRQVLRVLAADLPAAVVAVAPADVEQVPEVAQEQPEQPAPPVDRACAAGVARGAQVQATRAISIEDVTLQDAIANPFAVLRGHAFRIEGRATQGAAQVRPF